MLDCAPLCSFPSHERLWTSDRLTVCAQFGSPELHRPQSSNPHSSHFVHEHGMVGSEESEGGNASSTGAGMVGRETSASLPAALQTAQSDRDAATCARLISHAQKNLSRHHVRLQGDGGS